MPSHKAVSVHGSITMASYACDVQVEYFESALRPPEEMLVVRYISQPTSQGCSPSSYESSVSVDFQPLILPMVSSHC